jgi:hypothetical protein
MASQAEAGRGRKREWGRGVRARCRVEGGKWEREWAQAHRSAVRGEETWPAMAPDHLARATPLSLNKGGRRGVGDAA